MKSNKTPLLEDVYTSAMNEDLVIDLSSYKGEIEATPSNKKVKVTVENNIIKVKSYNKPYNIKVTIKFLKDNVEKVVKCSFVDPSTVTTFANVKAVPRVNVSKNIKPTLTSTPTSSIILEKGQKQQFTTEVSTSRLDIKDIDPSECTVLSLAPSVKITARGYKDKIVKILGIPKDPTKKEFIYTQDPITSDLLVGGTYTFKFNPPIDNVNDLVVTPSSNRLIVNVVSAEEITVTVDKDADATDITSSIVLTHPEYNTKIIPIVFIGLPGAISPSNPNHPSNPNNPNGNGGSNGGNNGGNNNNIIPLPSSIHEASVYHNAVHICKGYKIEDITKVTVFNKNIFHFPAKYGKQDLYIFYSEHPMSGKVEIEHAKGVDEFEVSFKYRGGFQLENNIPQVVDLGKEVSIRVLPIDGDGKTLTLDDIKMQYTPDPSLVDIRVDDQDPNLIHIKAKQVGSYVITFSKYGFYSITSAPFTFVKEHIKFDVPNGKYYVGDEVSISISGRNSNKAELKLEDNKFKLDLDPKDNTKCIITGTVAGTDNLIASVPDILDSKCSITFLEKTKVVLEEEPKGVVKLSQGVKIKVPSEVSLDELVVDTDKVILEKVETNEHYIYAKALEPTKAVIKIANHAYEANEVNLEWEANDKVEAKFKDGSSVFSIKEDVVIIIKPEGTDPINVEVSAVHRLSKEVIPVEKVSDTEYKFNTDLHGFVDITITGYCVEANNLRALILENDK